jgi:hypothetical protein
VIDVPSSPTTSGSLTDHGAAPLPTGSSRSPRPRRWFIAFAIFTTALLCGTIIALLYVQWFRAQDRSALIVVWLPPEWDGATAIVSGPALNGDMKHRLTKEQDMIARFHVPPGVGYLVRIEKDKKEISRRDRGTMRLLQSGGVWWPFRAPPSATQMGLQ